MADICEPIFHLLSIGPASRFYGLPSVPEAEVVVVPALAISYEVGNDTNLCLRLGTVELGDLIVWDLLDGVKLARDAALYFLVLGWYRAPSNSKWNVGSFIFSRCC